MSDIRLIDAEGLTNDVNACGEDWKLPKAMDHAIKLIDAHTVKPEWARIEECDWPDDMIVHWVDIDTPSRNGRRSLDGLRKSGGVLVMPACWPAKPIPDASEPEASE